MNAGLLDLKGNDAWLEHMTRAADELATYIAAHPDQLLAFVYSAVDPSERPGDPSREKAKEILKRIWQTYGSVSIGSPDLVFRGLILDAIIQNTNRDGQFRLAVTLILSSVLPHIKMGKEAAVWQETIDLLIQSVESEAEERWSVPTLIELPNMPSVKAPELKSTLAAAQVDQAALLAGLAAASGPKNSDAEDTGGNQYLPNSPQNWVNEFAPRAADAIGSAVNQAAAKRSFNVTSDEVFKAITKLVSDYVGDAVNRLAAATHGVELRSRLLWWKEAKVSPTVRLEYRAVEKEVIPALMAWDYQTMLPALAPVSVVAFLRDAILEICGSSKPLKLSEYLSVISNSSNANVFKNADQGEAGGLRPLCSVVCATTSTIDQISELTVFDKTISMSAADFATVLFREFQAIKVIASLEPTVIDTEANEK